MLAGTTFEQWYGQGAQGSYVRTRKLLGGVLEMIEAVRPAGDMSHPPLESLVLYQDRTGGIRVSGNSGGGHFDVVSRKEAFFLGAPNVANRVSVDAAHQVRSLSFPVGKWQHVLDEAVDGSFQVDALRMYQGQFQSQAMRTALRSLWALREEDGAPSRLLARSAGCQILAELCRLGGAPLAVPAGGLAASVQRRCIELMRARMSDNLGLDELAAEARLSTYHFARMFKQSVGVPPATYLTQLRMETACELLASTARSITDIAMEVGYASSQAFSRVFHRHRHVSPGEYRRQSGRAVSAILR